MSHSPGDHCGLFGDVSKFFGIGSFVDRGIGHKNSVAFANHDMNAERRLPFFRVKHAAKLSHGLGKCTGDARDHRIGLIHRQQ